MDWNAAIEKNREALKRVLAMLIAMAGLEHPSLACRPSLPQGERSATITLPRYLHRAVLRLLRPAEAATRRLVIVAARGIVVAVAPGRQPKTALQQARYMKNAQATRNVPGPPPPTPPRKGEGVVHVALRMAAYAPSGRARGFPSPLWGSEGRARQAARPGKVRGGGQRPRELCLSFPLFDPLRRFHRRKPARRGVPRISFPGFSEPFPIPPPPSADDPTNAARLALRLTALGRVLDDLPREARRFARWRANRDLASRAKSPSPLWGSEGRARQVALPGKVRGGGNRRVWPLRPGRPPGHRPANHGPRHEVHDILDVTHGLAFWALEKPDTS
jgi:hypothetical protein